MSSKSLWGAITGLVAYGLIMYLWDKFEYDIRDKFRRLKINDFNNLILCWNDFEMAINNALDINSQDASKAKSASRLHDVFITNYKNELISWSLKFMEQAYIASNDYQEQNIDKQTILKIKTMISDINVSSNLLDDTASFITAELMDNEYRAWLDPSHQYKERHDKYKMLADNVLEKITKDDEDIDDLKRWDKWRSIGYIINKYISTILKLSISRSRASKYKFANYNTLNKD